MLNFEQSVKTVTDKMFTMWLLLYGIQCSVYEAQPPATVAQEVYNREAEGYVYGSTPDYEGKFVITGLHELRFGATDEWTPDDIKMYTPIEASYIPGEHSKIVAHDQDQDIVLYNIGRQTIVGEQIELIYIHDLQPFN